ncbi:ubiquitin [Reticulomyxa filosa]|uniref:Ubiquitin n=1 Tax=Reticulomyxa filosa TaxID=46433 RepID=X6MDC4_RETFI|nr:ubiquitin [Reticulomyxa filosa]|eukprot:ETO11412.1 ubiquitin [Reticulomyxa filosa]
MSEKEQKIQTITIKTPTGKIVEIELDESDTVEKLKQEVEKEQNVKVNKQKLFYGEEELQDSKLVSSYGIKEGSFVRLSVPVRGGVVFSAPDVDKQQTKKTGKNEFRYWTVSPGLNYGGRCSNEDCKACDERVMASRGFGKFQPNIDEHVEEVIRCPGCKQTFEPSGFYFYRCNVSITFKKEGEKSLTRMPKKKVEGENYWELGGEEHEKAVYNYLEFEVEKL